MPDMPNANVSEEDKYSSRKSQFTPNLIKHNVMCHLVFVHSLHSFDSFSLHQYYFSNGVIGNNNLMNSLPVMSEIALESY